MKKFWKRILDTIGDPTFTYVLRNLLVRTLVDTIYLFIVYLLVTSIEFADPISFILVLKFIGIAFFTKLFFMSTK